MTTAIGYIRVSTEDLAREGKQGKFLDQLFEFR